MDSNQKPQTTAANQFAPVHNPPSLVEPGQPLLPSPVVTVDIPHPSVRAEMSLPYVEPPQPISPEPMQQQPIVAAAAPLPQLVPQSLPSQPAAATNEEPATEAGFYHAGTGLEYNESGMAQQHAADSNWQSAEVPISWVSSGEAIQAHSQSWKVKMTALSVVVGVLTYLVTRDWVSAGSVAVAGSLFGLLGGRKPQPLQYQVSRDGIVIGQRPFAYKEFRAFSVADDGSALTINFVPLKRFSPVLSVHADPELHDNIVIILSNHLPQEVHKRDAIDAILNKARF